jgi:hypothetical protein
LGDSSLLDLCGAVATLQLPHQLHVFLLLLALERDFSILGGSPR